MSSLKDAAELVKSETKKTDYDPKTGTNWCHLSREIRMQCVESMNFKSKVCLRATATVEKSLVDWKKMKIDTVKFMVSKVIGQHMSFLVYSESSSGTVRFSGYSEFRKDVSFLDQALKMADIRNLHLGSHLVDADKWNEILEVVNRNDRFRVETLILHTSYISPCLDVLRHCDGVETLSLTYFPHLGEEIEMDDLVEIPAVFNAKHIYLMFYSAQKEAERIFEKWLQIDAEVGRTFVCKTLRSSACVEDFVDMFEDQMVSHSDNTLRFEANNDTKHVIVNSRSDRDFTTIIGALIPADLSEYDAEDVLHDITFNSKV